MQSTHDNQRKLYVGMHDVCAIISTDAARPGSKARSRRWPMRQPASVPAQRHRNAPMSRRMRLGCIARMTGA